jgi:hypothetical protein
VQQPGGTPAPTAAAEPQANFLPLPDRWRFDFPKELDRAVDESGNQLAVFGRRGSRPLDLSEMYRMYLKGDKIWTVTDSSPAAPQEFRLPAR